MIDTAKELKGDNLTFQVMDINNFRFNIEFDVIFSNATLHWIKGHEKLLTNCYQVLKPNGLIRWNFAGDGNCSNFYEVIKEMMSDPAYKSSFINFDWPWYMPDVREYESLVKQFNFREVKVWHENADRYFPNADEMTKWIDQPSIVPFLKYVPQKEKREFRDQVVAKMIHKTRQPDGTCFELFRRINVLAIK